MKITKIDPKEFDGLVALWESSVRATHDFLTEHDIAFLKPLVRSEALPQLTLRGMRNDAGEILGFLGVSGNSVETLFLSPLAFGKGIGTQLMDYAEQELGTSKVDVNEQNQKALGFYQHRGYKIIARSPLDGQGRPFPILHMEKILKDKLETQKINLKIQREVS